MPCLYRLNLSFISIILISGLHLIFQLGYNRVAHHPDLDSWLFLMGKDKPRNNLSVPVFTYIRSTLNVIYKNFNHKPHRISHRLSHKYSISCCSKYQRKFRSFDDSCLRKNMGSFFYQHSYCLGSFSKTQLIKIYQFKYSNIC